MKGYGILLRLTVKNRLAGLRLGSWRRDDGKIDFQRIIAVVMAALGLAMLLAFIIFIEITLYNGLNMIGQRMLLPAVALMAAMLGTVMIGFFHVLASLYFNQDTAMLAYLPVRSHTVLAARMTEIYLGETLLNAAILLPAFIMLGVRQGFDALYYVRALLIVLCAACIPLGLCTLLSTVIARLTSTSRHKEAMTMIGSALLLTVVLVAEMTLLPKIPDDADLSYFAMLILRREALLQAVTSAFPPVRWAVNGLTGDWAQLLLFVAVSLAVAWLCVTLLGRRYFDLCLRQDEQATRRRALRTTDKTWHQRSPFEAILRREINEVLKTPVYAFNCLSSVLMIPIMCVAMVVGSGSSAELGEVLTEGKKLIALIAPSDLMLIFTAIVSFTCFSNPAASTAVSREGGRHEISRMIPVSARTQLHAKLVMGMSFNLLSSLVAALIIAFVLPEQIISILLALLLTQLLSFAATAVSLTLDAMHPRFHWANETQAIKQNTNMVLSMLIELMMYALPIVAVVLIKTTPAGRLALVCAILLIEAGLSGLLLERVGEKRYRLCED